MTIETATVLGSHFAVHGGTEAQVIEMVMAFGHAANSVSVQRALRAFRDQVARG